MCRNSPSNKILGPVESDYWCTSVFNLCVGVPVWSANIWHNWHPIRFSNYKRVQPRFITRVVTYAGGKGFWKSNIVFEIPWHPIINAYRMICPSIRAPINHILKVVLSPLDTSFHFLQEAWSCHLFVQDRISDYLSNSIC